MIYSRRICIRLFAVLASSLFRDCKIRIKFEAEDCGKAKKLVALSWSPKQSHDTYERPAELVYLCFVLTHAPVRHAEEEIFNRQIAHLAEYALLHISSEICATFNPIIDELLHW